MKPFKTLILSALVALPAVAFATDADVTASALERWREDPTTIFEATEVVDNEFLWIARPILVFSDTDLNPDFQRQVDLLKARMDQLVERDVVVIVDADPAARSDWRQRLRPRGFMLAFVDKDGGVKLRRPAPRDVREITRAIDATPLRQREVNDRARGITE